MPVNITLSDIVYYLTLGLCISLGGHYKKITDSEMKRNYGAGLGILVTSLICGFQVYHSVFIVWGNIIIMKCCDKRYIHHVSLAYTLTYLTYICTNRNRDETCYDYWIYQIIALRVVGLAFEIHLTTKFDALIKTGGKVGSDLEELPNNPTAVEIIAYAYYFIGIHKGPYYRWKVFQDHFNTPFGVIGDFNVITLQKLKRVVVCSIVYILMRSHYPIKKIFLFMYLPYFFHGGYTRDELGHSTLLLYLPFGSPGDYQTGVNLDSGMNHFCQMYYSEEFYKVYHTDDRYLYNIPQLVMYCLKYHIIMMLCSCVCTEAGFGIYPAQCVPLPGLGPSTKKALLKVTKDTKSIYDQEYNIGMLKSFTVDKLLFGPRMRDTLKGWDMSKRYWFWSYPYRSSIRAKKIVRGAFAFCVWAVHCGVKIQSMIVMCTLWVHINLEDEFMQMFDTTGSMSTSWDIGFSIMRMLCLIYLTPCFVVTEQMAILKYYNSIYWVFHVIMLGLLVTAVGIQKNRVPDVVVSTT